MHSHEISKAFEAYTKKLEEYFPEIAEDFDFEMLLDQLAMTTLYLKYSFVLLSKVGEVARAYLEEASQENLDELNSLKDRLKNQEL